MGAVRDIYAHYVLHSLATFEETPPTLEDMLARRRKSVEASLPYLIAEVNGETLGFAYVAPYRDRPAYRFTVEDSVYVASGLHGRGIVGLVSVRSGGSIECELRGRSRCDVVRREGGVAPRQPAKASW